jgi:uncharacterized membrane protein
MPVYALLADGVDFRSALSRSVNGVGQDWLQAGLFVLVFTLLFLVSLIPLGLGQLVTLPMSVIIGSLVYRDMIGMPGTGPEEGSGGIEGPDGSARAQAVWPPKPGSA